MLFDVGLGEILLIAVLALLVFGPDRLPKVAADAARTLRQVRAMASAARRELTDAAGMQDEELSGTLRDLRSMDPRRALFDPPQPRPGSAAPAPAGESAAAAISGSGGQPDAPTGRGGAEPESGPGRPTPPVVEPAVDPDWT